MSLIDRQLVYVNVDNAAFRMIHSDSRLRDFEISVKL